MMLIIPYWLIKIETNNKASKFKAGDRIRITRYKETFSEGYTYSCSKEIHVVDAVLKTNLLTYIIKDLKGETIIRSFYEKIIFVQWFINDLLSRTR